MDAKTIIKNIDRLKTDRSELDRKLDEVSSFACPEKTGSFFGNEKREGQEKQSRIITDVVSEANSIMARGLYSNLCQPGVKFYQYQPMDKKGAEQEEVKRAFAAASNLVFQTVSGSNLSTELSEAFEDYGWAGIVNVSVEPDPKSILKFRNYHISEYYVNENSNKRIEEVYREFRMTARQIVNTYSGPDDQIPEEIRENGISDDMSKSEQKYVLIHAVVPNRDVRLDKDGNPLLGNRNKKWKSITVCREKNCIIRESGFDYNPYTVARFEKKSDSMYGYSPGLRVLRTAKVINRMLTTLVQSAHLEVDPPVLLDMRGYKNDMEPLFFRHPGATNYYDGSTANPPQWMPVRSNLQAGLAVLEKFEKTVNNAYFVNLFQMLQQLADLSKQERTRYEIMQLVSEKNTLIIPIVSRILDELFQPLFLKAFYLCLESGKFENPELMLKYGVDVQFESPLALAARKSKVNSAFEAVSKIAGYSELDGGVSFDYVNFDRITCNILESSGVDPEFIRTKSQVEQLRKQRQEAAQQQQQAQEMTELAKSQDLMKRPESGSMIESLVGS